jgi:hypothetical protein
LGALHQSRMKELATGIGAKLGLEEADLEESGRRR